MKSKKLTILFLFIVIGIFILNGCAFYMIPKGYSPISKDENGKIYKKYDEFKQISFYKHKNFCYIGGLYYNRVIEIYIGENDNNKYLRMRFVYWGPSWIFFENATLINAVGNKIEFSFNSFDKKTDVLSAGRVEESIDFRLSDDKANNILDIISLNRELRLRLSGTYYQDYRLTKIQIKGIEEILNYYFANN